MNYRIGDSVLISATASMGYDEHDERRVFTIPLEKPIQAQVIGAVRRQLGRYRKAGRPTWDGEGDYDPPSLTVTGTVVLIQCRARMFGKIIEAREEDLVPSPDLSRLPVAPA